VVVFLLNADVVDGNANFVLGTVFAVIIKYMKLDEEDAGSSDVKEALLLWAKNKTTGYKDVSVGNASSPPPKKRGKKYIFLYLQHPPKKTTLPRASRMVLPSTPSSTSSAPSSFLLTRSTR